MNQNGVTAYQRAAVDIFFPEGRVCCDLCPIMGESPRKWCRRTGDYIFDSRTIHPNCPLHFIERSDDLSGFQC